MEESETEMVETKTATKVGKQLNRGKQREKENKKTAEHHADT